MTAPEPITRRTFSSRELLETLPDVIAALRDPSNHRRGQINAPAIDAADSEFATLWVVAESLGLDLTGIPAYRVGGWVRGVSPRTLPIHVKWVTDDVLDRLGIPDPYIHLILWQARSRSIQISRDAASIMLGCIDLQLDDEFDQFRAEDAA